LNQEFSFSTSITFYICEKILKVQFTPCWTRSKPYFTIGIRVRTWILVKFSIHGRE